MSSGPHGYELLHVDDRATWRRWLERNHASAQGVWVVSRRRQIDRSTLDYDALVEEALCFGWWTAACSPSTTSTLTPPANRLEIAACAGELVPAT